jgi:hypothetical protein
MLNLMEDICTLLHMRLRSKFSPRWDGPYVVTRKMGSLNYTVRRETENFGLANSELVVHVNRMKLLPPKNQKKKNLHRYQLTRIKS